MGLTDIPALIEALNGIADEPFPNRVTAVARDAAALLKETQGAIEALQKEYDDTAKEGLRYQGALRRQLEEARTVLRDCADDLEAEVNDRYGGPDDVHPGIRHRYERDMGAVRSARAALAAQQDGET